MGLDTHLNSGIDLKLGHPSRYHGLTNRCLDIMILTAPMSEVFTFRRKATRRRWIGPTGSQRISAGDPVSRVWGGQALSQIP